MIDPGRNDKVSRKSSTIILILFLVFSGFQVLPGDNFNIKNVLAESENNDPMSFNANQLHHCSNGVLPIMQPTKQNSMCSLTTITILQV
jgi:hypothetical protein